MKLTDALAKIHAPKGESTIIAAIHSGDLKPIAGPQVDVLPTLEAANTSLANSEEAQNKATSDWAYWGYAGDVAYWRCVVSLLEAAKVCGPDFLPDVPLPSMEGAVMDVQYKLEQWGESVLREARKVGTSVVGVQQ